MTPADYRSPGLTFPCFLLVRAFERLVVPHASISAVMRGPTVTLWQFVTWVPSRLYNPGGFSAFVDSAYSTPDSKCDQTRARLASYCGLEQNNKWLSHNLCRKCSNVVLSPLSCSACASCSFKGGLQRRPDTRATASSLLLTPSIHQTHCRDRKEIKSSSTYNLRI